jgi:hypothetical protein
MSPHDPPCLRPRATIIESASGQPPLRLLSLSDGARMLQPVLGIRQFHDVFRRVAQRDQGFPV